MPHANHAFVMYFWVCFIVSFVTILPINRRLSSADNAIGSIIVSLFGFVLWPMFLGARYKWNKDQVHGH